MGGNCFGLHALCRWLLAVGLSLLAGCEDVNHDYMPLAVGNCWTYRDVVEARGRTDWLTRPGEVWVREITGKLDEFDYEARYGGRREMWSKKHGFLAVHLEEGPGLSTWPLLKYPPHTGTRWDWPLVAAGATPPGTGTETDVPFPLKLYFEVVGRERMAVPAGTFLECLHVVGENFDRTRRIHYWFAPEIGLVRHLELEGKRGEKPLKLLDRVLVDYNLRE